MTGGGSSKNNFFPINLTWEKNAFASPHKLNLSTKILFGLNQNYRTTGHYRTPIIVHRTNAKKGPKLSYNYRIIVQLATLICEKKNLPVQGRLFSGRHSMEQKRKRIKNTLTKRKQTLINYVEDDAQWPSGLGGWLVSLRPRFDPRPPCRP